MRFGNAGSRHAPRSVLALAGLVLVLRGTPPSSSPVPATQPFPGSHGARRSAPHAPDTRPDADAAWLGRVQRSLAEQEYQASRNGRGWQAPNRAHNLRAYFEAEGLRLHDRTAAGEPELVGLRLAALGRPGSERAVPAGEIALAGPRVEIRRPALVEWYVNTPAGLEQGFTLAERPEGDGPLALRLDLSSGRARASASGAVTLTAAGGRELRYDGLKVVDAVGTILPAALRVASPVELRIEVEDRSAAYPLTIDPIITSVPDALLDSNQAGAQMGEAASAGDVNGDGYADVIVGARTYDSGELDEGAAFVFLGGPAGVASGGPASAGARLESNQAGAGMGIDVGTAGDVDGDGYADVIVGAPFYDSGEVDEGAAFVFRGGPAGIANGSPASASARLESNQAGVLMGHSVASAGDVNGDGYADVIVGAEGYGSGELFEGAAFVFLGGPAGIASGNPASASARLESNQISGFLGGSVASAGDVNGDGYADVIVGATGYSAGEGAEGAAFVFLGGPAGVASGSPATAHAQLESNQTFSYFGISVASAGDVNGDGRADVIVGAQQYDSGEAEEGAAFVFLGGPAGILSGNPATASARLESNQAAAVMGASVASAGDVNGDGYSDVIVGAFQYDSGEFNEGAAFVFLGGPAGILSGDPASASARLESNQAVAVMGGSVASAGDVNGDGYADVIVAANLYDSGEINEGAAFVFLGGSEGILSGDPASAGARLASDQAGAQMGASVASAGDVNADGYSDVIVGAPTYDSGEADEGAAFVFLGGPGGIAGGDPTLAGARLESDQAGAQMGVSVASAGDVNGDGYADVIVGAYNYDSGEAGEGAAFVFPGGPAGIVSGNPAAASARLESNQPGAQMGGSVSAAGDVNGDGYADVVVGARFYTSGEANEGAAFVFQGGSAGILSGNPASASARLESNQVGALMGASVASAGDVNGDGYADLIVGAYTYDSGEAPAGAAFVFLGGPAGILSGNPASASARLESNQAAAQMGWSVASAGDVNGDGYADVIVGANHYSSGEFAEGAAFVFLGGPAGILSGNPASANARLESNQAGAEMGASVASAGDVNGDGYADLIVGANLYDSGEADEGAAFVFLGGPAGIASGNPASAGALLESNQFAAQMGASVASAGDVDGDGFADVIAGTPAYDLGALDMGAAFVFHGNGRSGRPVLTRQLRSNGAATPVQPWGLSHDGDEFQVRLTATNPEGRRHLAVESQACPAGASWGAATCVERVSSWVEAPSGLAVLTDTLPDLAADRVYRWRARVRYGPTALNPGVTLPARPAHGPWRRLDGQSREADIRTSAVANLGLALGDWPDPVVAGQTLSYTLNVANGGPSTARNLTATQSLPPGSTFLAASGSGWSCGELFGTLTCTRPSLPVGSSTVLVEVSAPASGPLDSSASVTSTTIDPNPFDDFAWQATFVTPVADLALSKTDGVTSVVPGSPVTYAILVTNSGPAAATGAIVNDVLPPILTGATWTCVPAGGATCPASGSGSISHAVSLPAGGSLAYSLSATVNASATGVLTNTATVTAPASVADLNTLDNQASDVDQLTPTAGLSITKTNGLTSVVPGQAVSYTLAATNAGPNHAYGARLTDALPAALTGATWTCSASAGSACPPSGSGSISHTVNLLSGGTLTYTLSATVGASATGAVSNSASIGPPAGMTDPDPANNSAVDTDPVSVNADLAVTKTDGLGTAVPGEPVTYTIAVTNAGPLEAVGARVLDSLPAGLLNGSWTCAPSPGSSCAAAGSGSIDDTVTLLAGGALGYTFTATIDPAAIGTLTNTVSAGVPAGRSDPNPADNTASDSNTLTPSADLAVSVLDSPDPAPVFGTLSYTLGVANNGPSNATGVSASLTLPAGLTFATASAGCAHASGAVTCTIGALAAGQDRSYTVSATADPGTLGSLTANASVSGGESDPAPANDNAGAATDVRFVKGDLDNDLQADLLLRYAPTGQNAAWLMSGVARRSNVLVTPDPLGLDWSIAGVDDFNADLRNDLALWNSGTGAVEFWLLGGPTGTDRVGAPVPLGGGALAPPWKLSASADFNHDGKPDLVWRNSTTQKIEIWTLDGTSRAGTLIPTPDQAADFNWEVVGAQDWNADGNTDFLWYNPSSGKIVLWFMDANVVRLTGQFTNPSSAGNNNWQVRAMGDYGVGPGGLAGTIDIVWRNATSGRFVVWHMDQAGNRTFGTFTTPDAPSSNPTAWTIVGPR